ncbi:MAG: hypothetical protein LBR65_02570 [Culturomica sp.]|jgi:hypothetical protein|nr:hypothetical protein [Culturomica sp.]
MHLHAINVVARYEVKLLKRSWLFRIFAILILLILVLAQLQQSTTLFSSSQETWESTALSSFIPFFTTYPYNIAQSIIVVFLAGSFLKRDKKLDTAEVIYVRPMSNAEYIVGKVWGITRVFTGLNLLVLLLSVFVNLFLSNSPFSPIPYLFYLFTISIPSLWFVLGFSFTVMTLLRNQAVTFVVVLGWIGVVLFYLTDKQYGLFDFFGVHIPSIFSDVTGLAHPQLFLLQRSVYLLAGIGFICMTIALMKRLPHRPWKTKVLGVLTAVLLLSAGFAAQRYLACFSRLKSIRSEYAAVYNQYGENPRARVLEHRLSVEPRDGRLQGESRLTVENPHAEPLSSLLLYLNPGLQIVSAESDGRELNVVRNRQAAEFDLSLAPGAQAELLIRYAGPVEEEVCYVDVEDEEFFANPKVGFSFFRYGKRYVYLEDRFTLLTPECLWYPVTEPPVYPAAPYKIRKNFSRYELTVIHPGRLTAVSQGTGTAADGKTVFTNKTLLSGISLTLADYEKKSIRVDSTDYELYHFPGHDYFTSYFTDLQDTLPAVIRQIRNTIEVATNRDYLFDKFVLAETPLPFTGYIRNWKGYTEQVMPEILFLPEKGMRTRSDFRASEWQMKRWQEGADLLEKDELQARVLDQYAMSTFNQESAWRSWDEAMNPFNVAPLFYGHTEFVRSDTFPVLDVALNTLQSLTESAARVWFFSFELTNKQRANEYLKKHSFEEAMSDSTLTPKVFYELLKLKCGDLKNYITARVPQKDFDSFMKAWFQAHLFRETPAVEFFRSFRERFGLDLEAYIHTWYTVSASPLILLKEVEAHTVVADEMTKYRISFKAYNPSGVDGIITARVQNGGRASGGYVWGGGPADVGDAENFIIPARSAREIKMIRDERPNQVTINTNISQSLPSEFTFRFSKVDTEVQDTTRGIFPVDSARFAEDPREIIIDNESPGFRVVESNKKQKLKAWFRKEPEDKYMNYLPFYAPSKWTAAINNSFYGTPVRFAHYKNRGSGKNSVEWHAEIPAGSYYDISVWVPKLESFQFGRRNRRRQNSQTQTYTVVYGNEKESIPVDFQQAEQGWYSLGNFSLPAGEVVIFLTDKVSAPYVVADAVKLTKMR